MPLLPTVTWRRVPIFAGAVYGDTAGSDIVWLGYASSHRLPQKPTAKDVLVTRRWRPSSCRAEEGSLAASRASPAAAEPSPGSTAWLRDTGERWEATDGDSTAATGDRARRSWI